ncbi:MAG: aryl-sulfate sulfotransferase [Flavobacteriales bacterium]|nr:aryl-sulfate sulfotransferase [Flavobacteriales bacterium]
MRNFAVLFAFGISIGQAQTIGLLEYSPGNLDGYVLFAPIPSTTTYLIDKCGREVHAWPGAYKPGQSVYMLDDGSLIRPASIPNNVFTLVEKPVRSSGSPGWCVGMELPVSDTGQCSHHDVYPMPNGHVLVLAWEKVSVAEALAQGRDPALLTNSLWPEKILELEPIGENQANIVWEWHTWDHLVQEFDDTKPNFAPTSEHPELVDLNYGNGMAQADWIHANALDYNADLDQIMISAHNFDELWVIDHSTTTAEAASHSGGTQGHGGDLLYRWGNPEAYARGTTADKRLFGQHNCQWIRPGLPRAGEVLVFNNGAGRPGDLYSSVDIFDTPVDGNGGYPIGVGVPLLPQHWISNGRNRFRLICSPSAFPVHSSCRTEDYLFVMALRISFELGTNNEKVWRYISPVN